MRLDEVDLEIIKQLQLNGRSSNREVGRILGVSEGTVRQRLKRLEQSKMLRLGLVSDARGLGEYATFFIRIRAAPREARAIADYLAEMPCCSFAGLTLGRFDVIALLGASSRATLIQVIERDIAPLSGLILLDVRESVGTAKHRYDLIHIP